MTNSHSNLTFNSSKFGIESILNLPSPVGQSVVPSEILPAILLFCNTINLLKKENEKLRAENAELKDQLEEMKKEPSVKTVVTALKALSKMTGKGAKPSLPVKVSEPRTLSPTLVPPSPTTRLSFVAESIRQDIIAHLENPLVQEKYHWLRDHNDYLFDENKKVFPQEVNSAPEAIQLDRILKERFSLPASFERRDKLREVQEEQIKNGWIRVVDHGVAEKNLSKKRKLMEEGDEEEKKRRCFRRGM